MPAEPEKVHGEPDGRYWNWPAPKDTCSNPPSEIGGAFTSVTAIASTKAVLSPPALFNPWKVIVCAPAVTLNTAVEKLWYEVPEGVKEPTTTPSTSTVKSC